MDRLTRDEQAETPSRAGGPNDRLLAWPRVKDITGLSRTTAWRMQKAGDFPPPVQVSLGRVGWWQSDLDRWKASRAPRQSAGRRTLEASPGVKPAPNKEAEQLCPALKRPEAAPAPGTSGSRSRQRGVSPNQIAFDFGG
ncbi:AlpA family phage regulatory protein [Brevundimonas sp.]|uniref:helix-turn-helix transcriptional regulator n=1 Tax=Brevundimonas sp. TaxID=1871086 RepID=UPI0028997755|nr:AlpA family phage regulatory protein [Brevundimonas sp.]